MSSHIEYVIGSFNVPSDTVRLVVTITSQGMLTELERRTAESLKRDGVSMRNINGDWIKEEKKEGV